MRRFINAHVMCRKCGFNGKADGEGHHQRPDGSQCSYTGSVVQTDSEPLPPALPDEMLIPLTTDLLAQIGASIRPRLEELEGEWEQHREMVEAAFEGEDIQVDWFGGNCPVQAEGRFLRGPDIHPFYFRARGQNWQLYSGPAGTGTNKWNSDWLMAEGDWEGGQFQAGWMPQHLAAQLIIAGITIARARLAARAKFLAESKGKSE